VIEIKQALQELKRGKAAAVDNIPPEAWKVDPEYYRKYVTPPNREDLE
jgi:hypothetical protein